MEGLSERLNLLLDLGRYTDAEKLAREGIRADPEWAAGYTHLARALLGRRRYRAAEDAAWEGVRKAPSDPWAHVVWGIVLLHQGRYRGAQAEAEEALHLLPDYVPAHHLLADVLAARGRYGSARSAALDGLRHDPTSDGLLATKGWAECRYGRLKIAEETARQGLAEHPTSDQLHNLLGCVLWQRAERCGAVLSRLRLHREADRHLTEAIRLDPTTVDYQENRRNNAVSCRWGVLWFTLLPAAALSGLTALAAVLTARSQTNMALNLTALTVVGYAFLPLVLLLFRWDTF